MKTENIKEEKRQLGTPLKRCGILMILIGLATTIVSSVAIGLDRGNEDELKKRTKYDVILGLDVLILICSVTIVLTGVLPSYLFRSSEYDLIKTKVKFMIASILSATLIVPVMIASSVATYVLRGDEMHIPIILCVLSAVQMLTGIVSSAYCCCSSWVIHKKKCEAEKYAECKISQKNGVNGNG